MEHSYLKQNNQSKLKNQCTEQTCWLRLDFVKELNNEDIERNTFRPKGPSKKYEWLSTTHINDVIEQIELITEDIESGTYEVGNNDEDDDY